MNQSPVPGRLSWHGVLSRVAGVGHDVAQSVDNSPALLRRASTIAQTRNGRNWLMERRKPGRPSKGDRRHVSYKLPVDLLDAARSYAEKHGMTATDLMGEALAARVGTCYQLQEGLPLNKAS